MSHPSENVTRIRASTRGPLPAEADMPSLIDNLTTMDEDDVDDHDLVENDDDCDGVASSTATKSTTPVSSTAIEDGPLAKDEKALRSPEPSTATTRPCWKRAGGCLARFYFANEYFILVILVILLAKAYPPLGAVYLAPDITASWIAVMFIFLLAGLGLKTEEFARAASKLSYYLFVFCYSFGVDSSLVFGLSRLLAAYGVIARDLADGMVIASSVPLSISMSVVLTKASGGDEAAAICQSAMLNLVGVFLSPALILGYIGVRGTVSVWKVFYKLAIRVLLPILVGQLLKWFVPPVEAFARRYKPRFKNLQMYSVVFIVYTVFCRTFSDEDNEVPIRDVLLMIVFVGLSLGFLMALAWALLGVLFRGQHSLRVAGLYGCTHKTVAMGIPLVNAIYEGNPAIGLYTLPLLIWHPMQLVVGSFLSPRLLAWVEANSGENGSSSNDNERDGVVVEAVDASSTASEEVAV